MGCCTICARLLGICAIAFWTYVAIYFLFPLVLGRGNLREVQAADSILVTGAGSGLGRHASLTMNHMGFTVFAGVRREEDGAKLKAEATSPDRLIPVTLDVTRQDHITAALDLVDSRVGIAGLTAIWHNAGGVPSLPDGLESKRSLSIELTPMQTFRQAAEVGYFGAIAVTQAFLPLLEKSAHAGRPGRFVFNSDAKLAVPYAGAEFGPLFGIDAVAASLRKELKGKGTGVDVIVIQPGAVRTKAAATRLEKAVSAYSDTYPQEKSTNLDRAEKLAKIAGSPQVVSDALVDAVLSSKPWGHYYPGPWAGLLDIALGHLLPDDLADKFAGGAAEPQGDQKDTAWVEHARKIFSEEPVPAVLGKKAEL